jgi:hypothetical protein
MSEHAKSEGQPKPKINADLAREREQSAIANIHPPAHP